MKKILKVFSLIILALACLLVPFHSQKQSVANASFQEDYSHEFVYEDNAMFLTYVENFLVGVDKDGYFYKGQENNTVFEKTGYKFEFSCEKWMPPLTFNNQYGVQSYLTYGNGLLVFLGFTDSDIIIYYSKDLGESWVKNNIGTRSSLGAPVSLIYGNGLFALMTATSIYGSANGQDWEFKTAINCVDYQFSFSSGYFFRVEYSKTADPIIMYSMNLVDWKTCESPIGILADDNGYTNPCLSIVSVNNIYYVIGFGEVYSSANLSTWKQINVTTGLLGVDLSEAYKVVPYQNGILFCTDSAIGYADIGTNGITNNTTVSTLEINLSLGTTAVYANTIIESDTQLCVGASGLYAQTWEPDADYMQYAKFAIFEKATKHTVSFIDYDGVVISSVKVVEGEVAEEPIAPQRDGYTFIGWDKDIAQPIITDTIFTAQYERNKLTISFLDYDGKTIKELSKEYGSTLEESEIPTELERTGYQFIGWDKDVNKELTSNTTFVAQYSNKATLTIKYPEVVGTSGLLDQFKETKVNEKTFSYVIGQATKSSEFNTFYNDILTPWINDYSTDGVYDYDVMFSSWDVEFPQYITKDLTITANTEPLYNTRLEYYSQLRFKTDDIYYLTFIGNMKIEKMVPSGTVINVDDYKRADVEYELYNASRNAFYNNLVHFEFLGWDKDITQPITEDTIFVGQYNMPQIHVQMYDAEDYMFYDEYQDISFLTIEDIVAAMNVTSTMGTVMEYFKNVFLFRWGEALEQIASQLDFKNYILTVKEYHNMSSQILTPYVQLDTVHPEIYDGIFGSASAEVHSPVLHPYSGSTAENNYTCWINPIVFSNTLYSLSAKVVYGVALDSAVKTVKNFFSSIGAFFKKAWEFIKDWWWVIAIVVLVIIFWEYIVMFLRWLAKILKALFVKIGKKAKENRAKRKKKKAQKAKEKKNE